MTIKSSIFNYTKVLNVGLASTLAASLSAVSAAQIEEIVVTAEKRSESVQDVPISINALSGSMIDDFGVEDTDDIEHLYPNLATNDQTAYNTGFAIRGVGTDNFHISGQQSVTTYIDDIGMVSPFTGTIGVFDMERVEVLRGPQNTLYGRNTIGGAVNFHTRRAEVGGGFSGHVNTRAGEDGLLDLEGAIGFDISENWAGRIAAMTSDYDGPWTNVLNGENTGGYERDAIRLSIAGDLSESSSIQFMLISGDSDGDDRVGEYSGNLLADGVTPCASQSMPVSRSLGVEDCYVSVSDAQLAPGTVAGDYFAQNPSRIMDDPNNPANTLINYSLPEGQTFDHPESGFTSEWDAFRVYYEHDFDNMVLNLIGSYDELSLLGSSIFDLTGFAPNQQGSWDVQQYEARLTSTTDSDLQWIVGLYYSTEDSQQDTWVGNTGMNVRPGIDIDAEYENKSVYAQLDYALTDQINLTGGVRYTEDDLTTTGIGWRRTVCAAFTTLDGISNATRETRADLGGPGCPIPAVPGVGPASPQEQSLSELGWKIGADYKYNDSSLVFASVSEGFKGGAFDNRALATGTSVIDPEFLTAYEIGYKGDFFDNTLQFNASYYLYDWENLQLFEIVGALPFAINIPETELSGLEVDVKWAPTDAFYLQVGVGTSDTEITSAPDPDRFFDDANTNGVRDPGEAVTQATVGDEVTKAPDLSYNIIASYTIPFLEGELGLLGTYRWTDENYQSLTQENPYFLLDDYGVLNARVAYAFGTELQHEVAIFGNNLTGETYCSDLEEGAGTNNNFGCYVASNAHGSADFGVSLNLSF